MSKSIAGETRGRPSFNTFQPEIDGTSCLLAVSAVSRCDACARACPAGALLIDDNGLSLDEGACIGCGLCIPACPEGAIASPFRPRLLEYAGKRTVFIGCQQNLSGASEQDSAPCLDAIGLRELAAIQNKGADMILIMSCPPNSCPTGGVHFRQRLKFAQAAFVSRGERFPEVKMVSPPGWLRMREKAKPCSPGRVLDRRGLFSLLAPKSVKTPAAASGPAAFGLPAGNGGNNLSVFVPQLDVDRCSGCDACFRVCPHDALIHHSRPHDGVDEYVIEPANCTGCQLCIDICEEAALSLKGPESGASTHIPLYKTRCTACGVPFHSPKPQDNSGHLCRICTKMSLKKKLFFVHGKE